MFTEDYTNYNEDRYMDYVDYVDYADYDETFEELVYEIEKNDYVSLKNIMY